MDTMDLILVSIQINDTVVLAFIQTSILKENWKQTWSVCETQMPPIVAYCKDGHGLNGIHPDNSRKILSQEMLMSNIKALIFNILLWIM